MRKGTNYRSVDNQLKKQLKNAFFYYKLVKDYNVKILGGINHDFCR